MDIRVILLLLCLVFTICYGCIPLNSRDITELKGQIAQLKIEFEELKQNREELLNKISSTVYSLEINGARELRNEVSSLNQSVENSKLDVDNKVNESKTIASVLPSRVYHSAYSDYVAGRYDLAYNCFQSFVEKYANAELAPQAQFYLGEILYSREMWQNAIKEYKKIEELYSKSSLVASAKLKIALCYENLGMEQEAVKIFSSIAENFTSSPEFLTAKEKMKIYNNVENK
jgi:tol-pal system protein YbgF